MPWGYQPRPEQTALEEAVQRVCNFWAMLLIIAKYAARTPDEETMGLVGMAVQPLREVSEYLGRDAPLHHGAACRHRGDQRTRYACCATSQGRWRL